MTLCGEFHRRNLEISTNYYDYFDYTYTMCDDNVDDDDDDDDRSNREKPVRTSTVKKKKKNEIRNKLEMIHSPHA